MAKPTVRQPAEASARKVGAIIFLWFVNAVRRAQQANLDFPFLHPDKLGHTAAMTPDTYGHLFDDDLEVVVTKMQHAARDASVGKAWASDLV